MPLYPSERACFAAMIEESSSDNATPLSEMSIEEFRLAAALYAPRAGTMPNVDFIDTDIQTRDAAAIRLRVFNPHLAKGPVLVFFPGNGYMNPLFEENAIACGRIASYIDIKVILVECRLVPEHPLLVSIQDGFDALRAVVHRHKELNIDPNFIYLGGFSSGAHCATAVCQLALEHSDIVIRRQVLLNGFFDMLQSYHEFDDYANQEQLCTREGIDYCLSHFGVPPDECQSPLYSPVYSMLLAKLPPTTILVSEYDGLRNDSEYFFQQLSLAGNQVEKKLIRGQSHNTIILRGAMHEGEDPAKIIADVIQRDRRAII